MATTKRLGPLQTASVKLASGGEVFVDRGGELPDDMAPGQLERLEAAGAFDGPPKPVNMTVPEASVALAGYLPPSITLGTDPETDVAPGTVTAITDDEPADPKRTSRAGR